MQIQEIDFPGDALGETYDVRKELTKCLQRASVSDTGAAKLREILGFAVKKLKDADTLRAADKAAAIAAIDAAAV